MASLRTMLILGVVAYYVVARVYKVVKALKNFPQVPPFYCIVDPFTVLGGFVIPRGWWNPGSYMTWNNHRYTSLRTETILMVPIFLGEPYILLSSPEGHKDILNDLSAWQKPERILTLNFMGSNVISSNPPLWRKHRKIAAPAFDNQTFMNVWEVTTKAYYQMVASSDWRSDGQHYFSSFNKFTTRLALLVIAGCGFNMQIDWESEKVKPTKTIDETIVTVSTHLIERAYVPRWLFRLLPALQPIDAAYESFERFLHTEIAAKKLEITKEVKLDGAVSSANKNVFGRIVAASESEGKEGLDISEITGNLFIFLFAGHETTAHSLVLTLSLLASYPKEQERIYDHIRSVIGDAEPTYENYNALIPVLHCFYEAIRLYPAAWITMRETGTDAVLSAPNLTPGGHNVVVPKGMTVVLDTIGACRNPRHFPSPDSFIPTRWATSEDLSAPPPPSMDTFLAFSSGPRTCLGKKFASVEAVCFLTLLLRDWKVNLKLDKGESVEAWHQRVLHPVLGMSLKTGDVPLLFTRRTRE